MTAAPQGRRAIGWVLLGLLGLSFGACCPTRRLQYDSPEAVLGSWQSQLCHAEDAEDMRLEYRCLSASLKTQIRGFETYVAARNRLLSDNLLAATFLKYGDLAARADERIESPDGRISLIFREDGQSFALSFERETWLVASFDDDRTALISRVGEPLGELVARAGERQWIELARPLLSEDQREHLKSVLLESRWKISSVDGLLATPSP